MAAEEVRRDIREIEADLDNLEKKMIEKREEAKEKEKELKDKEKELKDKEKDLTQHGVPLLEREKLLASMRLELLSIHQQLASMRQELASMRQELASMQQLRLTLEEKDKLLLEAQLRGMSVAGPSNSEADVAKLRKALEDLPRPSDMAQHATWQHVQEQTRDRPIFMCFRPSGNYPAALPVGLLHPVLDTLVGTFTQAVAGQGDPLSQADCQLAFDLCEQMAQGFSEEEQRAMLFTDLLASYIGSPITSDYPDKAHSDTVTNGSICCQVDSGGSLLQVPVYIQEAKLEMGVAGDPYFQGQRHYQLYLLNDKLAAVVRRTVLPVLFVELVGPHIRVSALASPRDACVVCEPLTPFLHLFNMLKSQRHHMDRVARLLRALKRGIKLLQEAWGALSTTPDAPAATSFPPWRDPSLRLPHPLRPGFGFRNVEALAPGQSCLLYVAEDEESGREVVVKFASLSEQAVRVHRAWAAAGLAPELIDARQLPCGLTMLVMEWLNPGDGWTMFHSLAPALKLQLSDAVLAKLQAAHSIDVGGGQAVHVDMRQANVMVKLQADGQQPGAPPEVRFLDFDWSGLVGQTRLPPFIWQRLPGYGSGEEATQQYDITLWRHELEHGDKPTP